MLTHAEFGEVSVCIQFAVLPYTRVRLISYLAGINARCLTRITVQCVGSYRRRSLPRPALSISKFRRIADFSSTSERFYIKDRKELTEASHYAGTVRPT